MPVRLIRYMVLGTLPVLGEQPHNVPDKFVLRKRILCVDDDKDSSDLLRALFDNHDVTTAKSIRQGLDLARQCQFDLYLLDSWFPDGDGVELCREIRAFDAETPIVFFSGITDKPYIARAMKAGAHAYLIKGTDMDKLEPTVELLLQGQRLL